MIDVEYRNLKTCAVIGYKNHALNIIKEIKKFKKIKIKYIYHPKKNFNKFYTNKFENVLTTDAVFILCPTEKHFFYLNLLKKNMYNGYIFCEKLPVSRKQDIKKLMSIKTNKIYFNFNLDHSPVAKILSSKKFGKIQHISIINNKPLLLLKNIKTNWRFKDKNILLTNILPHYLFLIRKYIENKSNKEKILIFGNKLNKSNLSKKIIMLIIKKDLIINLSFSYVEPIKKEIIIDFEKINIQISEKKIIYYSKEIKIKKNKILNPRIIKQIPIKDIFKLSNSKSVKFFLNKVINNEKFITSDYKLSLNVNKEILNFNAANVE